MRKLVLLVLALSLTATSCNNDQSTEIQKIQTKSPSSETQITPPTTKPKSNCNSNYSGCVPITSDVDCAGGSGNGPAYVSGPIYVTGSDVYDLDRDGDGVACE